MDRILNLRSMLNLIVFLMVDRVSASKKKFLGQRQLSWTQFHSLKSLIFIKDDWASERSFHGANAKWRCNETKHKFFMLNLVWKRAAFICKLSKAQIILLYFSDDSKTRIKLGHCWRAFNPQKSIFHLLSLFFSILSALSFNNSPIIPKLIHFKRRSLSRSPPTATADSFDKQKHEP